MQTKKKLILNLFIMLSLLECADKILVNSLDVDVLLLLIHHSQHNHAEDYISTEDAFEYISFESLSAKIETWKVSYGTI